MIVLFNPRATRPRNCRLPLSVLALAAVLEGREEYAIVDGNVDSDPTASILRLIDEQHVEMLGVTCMPGPQMAAAMESSREIRRLRPHVPIVWGGYFPSTYTDATLNAAYVDYAVRGQGEDTLLELLDALRGSRDFESIAGLSYKDVFGLHRHNPERVMKGPDAFPWMPFHRVPVQKYLRPSFFGKRTAVHHASIGCPFRCSFCGVHAAYGSRERFEDPARTAAILEHLATKYGADSVQFYDMNFFLREDHARDLAERLAPLGLRWWCEARVDVMSRYSDATLAALKRGGCTMVFFGAESGSDWALKEMKKGITTEQTLQVASRMRNFGIIPEFSFVVGNPGDPERDTRETLAIHPPDQAARSPGGDHHLPLHACTTAWEYVRRNRRSDRVSRHAGRMGEPAVDGFHAAHRSEHPLVEAQDQKPDRQFRNRRELTLAHGAGYSRAPLEPRLAAEPERVALLVRNIRLSQGTALGAAANRSASTEAGESRDRLMTFSSQIDDAGTR